MNINSSKNPSNSIQFRNEDYDDCSDINNDGDGNGHSDNPDERIENKSKNNLNNNNSNNVYVDKYSNRNKVTVYFPTPGETDDGDGDGHEWGSNDDNYKNKKEDSESNRSDNERKNNLLKYFFPDIFKAIGNKAIKENPPSLQELEQYLQNYLQELQRKHESLIKKTKDQQMADWNNTGNNIAKGTEREREKGARNDKWRRSSEHEPASTFSSQFHSQNRFQMNLNFDDASKAHGGNLPIVAELIKKGYLVDSSKWLRKKGFFKAGQQLLGEIIKNLKKDKMGMHETTLTGSGNILQETSKKYEFGREISNININATIQNFIERNYYNKGNTIHRIKQQQKQQKQEEGEKEKQKSPLNINGKIQSKITNRKKIIEFPLDISYEDLEIYETVEEIKVATVYCIDLSSTMKYSSMYNDLSRIEASKRALWSLYILNKKFFPLDSIYVIGFGSIASKIDIMDIPFLKTFEPNADFLHYTNYQAAYRLGKKILKKDGSKNKRIVMITDGHPSACFIDDNNEKDKILKQRPYSHFYIPDHKRLNPQYMQKNNLRLDIHDKQQQQQQQQTVYLCYRYRQIDQYIGEQTIKEAKKIKKDNIDIDTIMVSEEDTLLDFVNELAKSVSGKSIYINPKDIDKILITDYLSNKKKLIKKN